MSEIEKLFPPDTSATWLLEHGWRQVLDGDFIGNWRYDIVKKGSCGRFVAVRVFAHQDQGWPVWRGGWTVTVHKADKRRNAVIVACSGCHETVMECLEEVCPSIRTAVDTAEYGLKRFLEEQ